VGIEAPDVFCPPSLLDVATESLARQTRAVGAVRIDESPWGRAVRVTLEHVALSAAWTAPIEPAGPLALPTLGPFTERALLLGEVKLGALLCANVPASALLFGEGELPDNLRALDL
jgi:hypothetical protein